jgi:CheY-like chemotaxis protein
MRQQGFTATIFGVNIKVNGPADAVEKLSENVAKQINDLRAQMTTARGGRAMPEHTGTGRVLWVDDMPSNNLFEVGKLEDEGFRVEQVASTGEAEAALQKSQFALVITDMGRMEDGKFVADAGLQLIADIRERESSDGSPKTPVLVYCSPKAAAAYGQRARDAGADGVTASTTELLQQIAETT